MKKLLLSLRWLDEHLLQILVIGFIFFIPLYPKLPLKMVNYTYVAIRMEDIYVGVIAFAFAIQTIRRKVTYNMKYLLFIGLFWAAVFASYLWGYFIGKTIPVRNLGFLHSLRRVEYMLIFFVAYTTTKTRKDFMRYLRLMFCTLGVVCVYGIGQKFLGWPAVQTMNPEYAKGYLLVLDANARVSSTFAGHYDLAAYLILIMSIMTGAYLAHIRKWYIAVFFVATATLVLTASRASYGAFLLMITLFLLAVRKFKVLFFIILLTACLTPLSDNLTKRLTRTFQQTKIFVDPVTGVALVPKDIRPDDLPPGDFGANQNVKVPINPVKTVVDKKTATQAKKQIRESIVKEAGKSGRILTEKEISALVEKTFGRQIPVTKYLVDISLSTRAQVEWPRAMKAFISNPILGTGPSSITEATDGDYFRWLGETGIIGTTLFVSIIVMIGWTIFKTGKQIADNDKYIFYGCVSGICALMVNAVLIDVFEASKVAYTFWLVAGIFLGAVHHVYSKSKSTNL